MAKAKEALDDDVVFEVFMKAQTGRLRKLGGGAADATPRAPTGIVPMDYLICLGGLPRGKIVEVFGPEGGGKTTLALQCIAEAQSRGERCAFVDAEHALNLSYAYDLKVDAKRLVISQPDHGEEALDVVLDCAASGLFSIVVIDSVAALTPKAEIEGEMGDSHMGLQARMMGQAMRKLVAVASKTGTLLIFLNQTRSKIGVTWGSPETTTGGNALKFFATVRIDVRRVGSVKDGENIIGHRVRLKAVKNKISPPFKPTDVDFIFGKGYENWGWLTDLAIDTKLVEKSGSWFTLPATGLRKQGRLPFIAALQEDEASRDFLLGQL